MSRFLWLTNVKVIDLTTAWAGPAVGRFLGALGADVIKIESARRYDIWRGNANRAIGASASGKLYNQAPNFLGLNRNKRAISLELTLPEGRDAFLGLAAQADVMVSNFSARVLPNLGLDYDALRTVNPRLILLNMPSLGASGPYRDLAGYGSIIEGLGGLASRFGYMSEGARVSQTFFPDGVAGIHAALAVLAALKRRQRTGEGCLLDFSQQEAMWLQLGEGLVMSSSEGRAPERMGNGEPRRVPSGIFPTADGGWIAVVVKTDSQFAALVRLAPGLGEFAGHELESRIQRRSELEKAFGRWTSELTTEHLLVTMHEAGVSACTVNTYASGSKTQEFAAVDAIEMVDHAEVGSQEYLRIPIRFDGQPISTQRPGVRFSEHTDEVLSEWLRLSPAEVAHLRSIGVIADEIAVPD